jgi:IclR family pca regulon transcriptional regulator
LAILGCFTVERSTLGIAELADRLDFSRSTVHRYAVTLLELGYLEQGSDRKYRLGLRVTDLGLSAIGASNLACAADKDLRRLRRQTRLTTALAVLDDLQIVYLRWLRGYAISEGHASWISPLAAGSRLPAYSTAAGKVLLAHLPRERQANAARLIIAEQNRPVGNHGVRRLLGELEQIARDGVAICSEQSLTPLLALAVPIRESSNEVVGALSLIAPNRDTSAGELLDRHRRDLRQAAHRISSAHQSHRPPAPS